ncbi:MAG TPA: ribonuclease HII [candidate division Zixibacteria bacterium]|jgi:ribonuclease HII|nr:ribonuclease HII [candidate division Zixibacteria bacterium]
MPRAGRAPSLADFDLGTGARPLAGVDEAGRGPLAGPVVAAAVVLPPKPLLEGIDDSKRLSPKRRQALLRLILENAEAVGLGIIDAELIDRINILRATEQAMRFALCGLIVKPALILFDGPRIPKDLPPGCRGLPARAVVGGDAKSYCVAAASIVAKCVRDAIMREYDRQHPGYGFAKHKGYGTREHLECLGRMGPCPIHRRSFGPVGSACFGAGKRP